MIKSNVRSGFALLGSAALVLAGANMASANPFDGEEIIEGHYDVVLNLIDCQRAADGTAYPTAWTVLVENHDTGVIAGVDDFFAFTGESGPDLGFAVKFGDTCAPVGTPVPGVESFSFDIAADGVTTDPSTPLVLNGEGDEGYHEDVKWEFPNGAGDYRVAVSITGAGGSDLGGTMLSLRSTQ